jgi:hypothetical protein
MRSVDIIFVAACISLVEACDPTSTDPISTDIIFTKSVFLREVD